MAPPVRLDYRKALVTSHEEIEAKKARREQKRIDEETRIAKQLEAKNIFHKLPLEIRIMIWRILLLRPATILPGNIKYIMFKTTFPGWAPGNRYMKLLPVIFTSNKYQWDERRQVERSKERFDPAHFCGYHSEKQDLTIVVPTEPTFKQKEYISCGANLPFTFKTESGSQVGCEVIQRGETGSQFPQVINHVKVKVRGLFGLAMLQVSKQALAECSEVLYGENTFAFGTSSPTSLSKYNKWIHQYGELEHCPHWIPGKVKKNGAPQTTNQLNNAIDRIFNEGLLPKFVFHDPMLQFFRRIGRENAGLLTKIKIDGCMKTSNQCSAGEYTENPHLGFSRALPILTTVIKNVCPNIRELTLHMEDQALHPDCWKTMKWDDDPSNRAGKSDEQRIDECVEKVVTSLEFLQVLKLGGGYPSLPGSTGNNIERYNSAALVRSAPTSASTSPPVFEDQWGRSARWIKLVQERANKQAAEKAEKAKFGNTEVTNPGAGNTLESQEMPIAQSTTNSTPSGQSSQPRGNRRRRGRGGGRGGRRGRGNGRGNGQGGQGGANPIAEGDW